MKYLCLVYIEEKRLDALSKSELDALIDESLAYDEVLRKSIRESERRRSRAKGE